RFTINTSATHQSTRERPGFEIDERAQRVLHTFTAALSYPLTPNTGIEAGWRRDTTNYDEAAQFNGVNLHDELNVDAMAVSLGLRQRIAHVTSGTLLVNRLEDRHPFNPVRDSNRTEARMSVAFDPVA